MKRADLDECVALTAQILGFLIQAVPHSATTGIAGAQIHADIGSLNATAGTQLNSGMFSVSLANCFYDAFSTGISFVSMSNVRAQILTLKPVSPSAILLVQLAEYYSLVMEGRIIAAMTFTSSNQVENLITEIHSEFEHAQDNAANENDATVYLALINLHASITNLLVSSTYALPRIVQYRLGKSVPSLLLAQILYSDGSRADELLQENNVVHPAFMPVIGTALSQ